MKPAIPVLMLGLLALDGSAWAAEGSVSISRPAEGSILAARERQAITYEVDPGPRGDHVHLFDNGRQVAILRTLKGSHDLGALAPGHHELCIKVVNQGHVPIGIEECIRVEVR